MKKLLLLSSLFVLTACGGGTAEAAPLSAAPGAPVANATAKPAESAAEKTEGCCDSKAKTSCCSGGCADESAPVSNPAEVKQQ